MTLSLGAATDLACLQLSGSRVTKNPSHIVCHSPENPSFYWGNYVQVLHDSANVTHWQRVFNTEFPHATHQTFRLPSTSDLEVWHDAGFFCETIETLVSDGLPHLAECPRGYVSRRLDGHDWDALAAFHLDDNDLTRAQPSLVYDPYVASRIEAERQRSAAGHSAFFGCFDDDGNLAASLGIVVCPPTLGTRHLSRFQTVLTSPAHRGRGLATHMLGLAAAWASRRGATRHVICAESTNSSVQVYKAAGFRRHQTAFDAARYPYA